MIADVLRAHAAAMAEWSNLYRSSSDEGAAEMAFLLDRAARLGTAMANGEPITLEPIEAAEPAVDEPKEG